MPEECGGSQKFGLWVIMREDDGVAVRAQPVDLPAQVKTGKRFADGSSHGFSLSGFGRRPPTPRLRAGQFGRRRVNAMSTRGWSSQNAPSPLRRCPRSEEHTSELQSLMRISYAVFCLKKKKKHTAKQYTRPCTLRV